ncbi:MAG: hypothetical protein WCF81_23685 [Roseiarcus sp.]
MSVQIFLSAVSDEFRDYREQLRHDLTRPDVEVKVQEDFIDLGSVTLDKLDVYIDACDAVVHLVGDMTGAAANAASTTAISGKYVNLIDKLTPLRLPLENRLDISYTQWEAWLALYHDKPLLIAKADDIAPRGPKFDPTDASRVAQRAHLDRLHAVGRYPGCTFTSPDNLAKQILSSVILDLLVSAAQSVTSIGSVKEQLNAAVAGSNETYDRRRLKDLQADLRQIQAVMVTANDDKKVNIEVFRDYIRKDTLASTWEVIQKSFADISDKVRKLRLDLEKKQAQVVDGVGFKNAGDLQAALQYQGMLYERLSTFPKPDTDAARAQLGTTVDKLEALRDQVVGLESSIETYLDKFPSQGNRQSADAVVSQAREIRH